MTLYNLEKSIKLSVSEYNYNYDYTKLNHFCNELRQLINRINEYKQFHPRYFFELTIRKSFVCLEHE